MKITEMQNLFSAYDETDNFRMLVLAENADDAEQIVSDYAADANLSNVFVISDEIDADMNFDCDRIISKNDIH